MADLNSPENQGKKQSATHVNQDRQQDHQAPEDQKISQQEQSLNAQEEEEIRKRANARTEAEAQSIDGKAGQSGKSSENHMSHTQAGTHKHPGGGAKGHHNSR